MPAMNAPRTASTPSLRDRASAESHDERHTHRPDGAAAVFADPAQEPVDAALTERERQPEEHDHPDDRHRQVSELH